MSSPRLRALTTLRATTLVWAPLLLIAAVHYLTPSHSHWVHDIARRLYYVPIVFGGVLAGLRGGLVTASVTVVLYFPHAFTTHFVVDPGTNTQKVMEVGFYFLLGVASGLISERLATEARHQAELAQDLQRTLDEVRAKEAELQRAARLQSLGELTAGLAHEIRNPLHAMRGAAEIVLDAVPAGSEEHQIGARWIDEIDRLSSVLSRFLRFAKGSPPSIERVQLSSVTDTVYELLEPEARRQQTALSRPQADEREVAADRDQIVQVVLGLCINALQALGQGGTLRLVLETETTEGGVLHGIRVVNDGPPIAPEDLERIFDPFFTTRGEGTGLGLSMAWRIVSSHGGRLEVEDLGESAEVVFRVLLPAWRAQCLESSPPRPLILIEE